MSASKLPHSLRIPIFLLRIVLGLNFFYLGWSALFDASLEKTLSARSFGELYAWIGSGGGVPWLHAVAPWAFAAIGALLVLGLLTRIAAAAGIILVILSYFPTFSYSGMNIYQLTSDGAIAVICLAILIIAHAGTYLGFDKFFHVRFASKKEE